MTLAATGLNADLPPGTMHGAEVDGKGVLVANVGGTLYAMARKCPHMGADLCKGKLEGSRVTCRMHGASYDLKTGEAVEKAKLLFFKTTPKPAKTYPVKVADGAIMIEV